MTDDTTLVDELPSPRLVVKVHGRVTQEVALRAEVTIGRAEDNDLRLTDPKASRHHACVSKEGIDFVLESQLLRRKLPDKCLNDCELLPICMGGCRLQALVNQEDFDEIDCHYDSQRLFLEDYIREKASAVSYEEEDIRLKAAA